MSANLDPTVSKKERCGDASAAERGSDLLSMFYLPSSHQFYDEDVTLAASSYTYSAPSLQGAASAVMGGIWSVLDTALAVLNEEFDNPSDSMLSDGTKDDGEDQLHESVASFASCKSSGAQGCRQPTKKLPKSATDGTNRPSSYEDAASSGKCILQYIVIHRCIYN